MGLANQEFRPAAFGRLPAALVSHTAEHASLESFRHKRVAVIGRGQSACESAALLAEAGCEVEIISRGDIHWLGAQTSGNAHRRDMYWRLHKLLATKSGVGPFPLNWINEEPGLIQGMPRSLRRRIITASVRAGAAGWVKPRVAGVRVNSGRTILSASTRGDTIVLDLDNGSRDFDHVLLGTGYRIDVAKLGLLAPELAE